MTEFDLALEFLQTFARAATAAGEEGESLDGGREFHAFCVGQGVRATAERGELVRDLAGVISECVERGEHEWDAEVPDPDHRLIPAGRLADGLERQGWRLGFLNQDVGG